MFIRRYRRDKGVMARFFRGRRIASLALALTLAITLTLLAACGRDQQTAGASLPTVVAPADKTAPPTETATRMPAPTIPPTQTPTATATVTPTPTATPRLLTLAAPSEWIADLSALLAKAGRPWDLMPAADPAAEIAAGQAHVALEAGENGVPVGQEPLVLAVPFTAEWEETTLAQAQAILDNGHALVTELPWRALTPALKPLRVDGFHPLDPAYPLQQPWSLTAAPGHEEGAEEVASVLRGSSVAGGTVHLAAVGDVMLDRALGAAINNGNVDYPFVNVSGLLQTGQ